MILSMTRGFSLPLLVVCVLGCASSPTLEEDSSARMKQDQDAVDETLRQAEEEALTAAEEAAEEPSGISNTLRWRTASEVDNFGFDVYRGDDEEGPFDRLTAEPIPGAGTTDEPQTYSFDDPTIAPGTVYWYYVESISMSGVREQFTPVFASKPKWPDDADGDDDK